MKCRGALERRSGTIDLQELLIYRNRHISYSGGIHPQIWLLLSTCFRFLWRTALRECTSYLSKSKNARACPCSWQIPVLCSPSQPVPHSVTALSPGSCPFSLSLPFIKSPSYGFLLNFITHLSSTLALSSLAHLDFLSHSLCHRKGQLTDLRTPESPVSRGLDLICINLHNFIKAQGDAVHTAA